MSNDGHEAMQGSRDAAAQREEGAVEPRQRRRWRRTAGRAAIGVLGSLVATAAWAALAAAAPNASAVPGEGASCDPSRASCIQSCGALGALLGTCTPAEPAPPSGGEAGGGGACRPSPGGHTACGGDGPASRGGGAGGGVSIGGGNPINLLTGNKFQEEVDLPPLPGVLGLELKRYYNSQGSHAGLLGAHWRMSYETVLVDLGTQIQIVQADGRRLTFQRGRGRAAALCSSPRWEDGQVRIDAPAAGIDPPVYHWRWPGGRTLTFAGGSGGGHPLQSIAAPTGERLTLHYGPDGTLLRVHDPQGRELRFLYAAGARRPRAVDTPLGRIRYTHDRLGRLREAALADVARIYHYEDAHNAGHVHALTGISVRGPDPDGGPPVEQRVATYGYNAAGQAILSVRGRPRESKDGRPVPGTGIEQVELAFVAPAPPFEGRFDRTSGEVVPRHLGRTVLTNSLGERTDVVHAVIGGHHRLIEMRGAGCAGCGPSGMRYGWDAHGLLTRVTHLDPDGLPRISERIEYDPVGRIARVGTQRHAPSGPPGRIEWTTRYAYADRRYPDGSIALAPRPSRIERPSVVAGRVHELLIDYDTLDRPRSWTERGYSPLDEHGQPQAGGRPIERTTTLRYALVGGVSVLTEIDGPLPNGPSNDPRDSDITRLQWDDAARFVIGVTLPLDRRITLAHDVASGRLAAASGPDAIARRWHFAADGTLVAQERALGDDTIETLSFRHDALGRVAEVERSAGAPPVPVLRQAFDVAGRLQWQIDRLGVLRQADYDTEGRLVTSRVRSATMRQEERYLFDPHGRLERIEDDTGAVQHLVHDAAGRISEIIDPLGRVTRFGYDDASRLVEVTQAAGTGQPLSLRREGLPHSARRDLLAFAGARRLAFTRWVDDFGRTVMSETPDGGRVLLRHDAADRLTQLRDAAGTVVDIEHDAAGRIVAQTVTPKAARGAREGGIPHRDAIPQTTRYRYDGERLVAVAHPQQDEALEYDAAGRVVARTVHLRSMAGERIDNVVRYAYDAGGRLVASSLPDGSELRYERNGQGQVVALHRRAAGGLPFGWGDELLASGLGRDLVGLREMTYGNGVVGRWQRSREGVLARVVVLAPSVASPPWRTALEALVTDAHATPAAAASAARPALPGAYGVAPEPRALWDVRLLLDAAGNVIAQSQAGEGAGLQRHHMAYLYDAHDQLAQATRLPWPTASARTLTASERSATPTVWRYHHDALGNRLLAQEARPSHTLAHTRATAYADVHSNRPADADMDEAGRPLHAGDRVARWDAAGRLVELAGPGGAIVRYRYDHRGLRVGREVGGVAQHHLYDDGRHRLADLDARGRVTREYIWLADQLVAVIDLAEPRVPDAPARTLAERIGRGIAAAWRLLAGGGERIAYVHVDHLGAPVLMTDRDARPVWSAEYAPFGQRLVTPTRLDLARLALRRPGQWEDDESGLYYNDQRYYDASRGRYLSPDPLGPAGGLNAYAYGGNNPLRYSDPRGLVLFAFDGTGNTDNLDWLHHNGSSLSNVVQFSGLYADGDRRYIAGVGTVDRSDPTRPIDPAAYVPWYVPLSAAAADSAGNYSGPARIERMLDYFGDEADAAPDDVAMEVDIVGFSRGAAQARDFANRLVDRTRGGWYGYTDAHGSAQCQRVDFRFMGLWDTVLSTNHSGVAYDLAIPTEFAYVAQAVALNEYRGDVLHPFGSVGAFPLESILRGPTASGQTVVERGFIGSHADIGGGFAEGENELAGVALAWMVKQASAAGVAMNAGPATVIASPVIHDKSDSILVGAPPPRSEDRAVRYRDGSTTRQRTMPAQGDGMRYADTQPFIHYLPTGEPQRQRFITGTVDMDGYLAWLSAHGNDVGLTVTQR